MQRREFLSAAGTGALAAGAAAGPAAAQDDDGNGTDAGGNQTESGGGGATQTVAVGPNGNFVFDPDDFAIQPGTTVVWEWDSDMHNVAPTSQPEGANWSGMQTVHDAGFTYEYTFEVEGTYEYVCEPHENADMEGAFEVTTDAGSDGGNAGPPAVPASATSLTIGLLGAMAAVGSLAFFFLKYGGVAEES